MTTISLSGLPERGRLVVALSGGRDSVVLLHRLRFGGVAPNRLLAAHLDHAMRPGSAEDADWVRGLCRAWRVPLVEARLLAPPPSEAAARARRWRFLEDVRTAVGAEAVVTGHHADDQAETVLHHVARGTGLRGLGAMRPASAARVRPLLEVAGARVADYAGSRGVRWREDPTNRDPGFTRNRIRHQVLPALEAAVPGARGALVRLARTARRDEAALGEAVDLLLDGLAAGGSPGRMVLDRGALCALGPPLRARVLRRAVRRLGAALDATGTRRALAFTTASRSGTELHLTGGVLLSRELDVFVLRLPGVEEATSAPAVRIEVVPGEPGRTPLRLASGAAWLHWRAGAPPADPSRRGADPWRAGLDAGALDGPLRLRPWGPGDRIRMRYGTKKLKKLLLEARLDRERRRGHPVLEDVTGRIVWVPGIPDAVTPALRGTTFHIWIRHEPCS